MVVTGFLSVVLVYPLNALLGFVVIYDPPRQP